MFSLVCLCFLSWSSEALSLSLSLSLSLCVCVCLSQPGFKIKINSSCDRYHPTTKKACTCEWYLNSQEVCIDLRRKAEKMIHKLCWMNSGEAQWTLVNLYAILFRDVSHDVSRCSMWVFRWWWWTGLGWAAVKSSLFVCLLAVPLLYLRRGEGPATIPKTRFGSMTIWVHVMHVMGIRGYRNMSLGMLWVLLGGM